MLDQNVKQLVERFYQSENSNDRINVNLQLMQDVLEAEQPLSVIEIAMEIMGDLFESAQSQKLISKSNKLKIIESKLRARQQKRKGTFSNGNTTNVHFIKDPSNAISHLASNVSLQNEDFQYIRKFY